MRDSSEQWKQFILTQGIFVAWIIAFVAMLGSLYFSEVIGFIPCELCWYQRIIMYPLVLLFLVAVLKKENQIVSYALPFSILGIVVSTYHYLLQHEWIFQSASDSCSIVPCNTIYIHWFGFITIPFLALIAFILITIICFLVRYYQRREQI